MTRSRFSRCSSAKDGATSAGSHIFSNKRSGARFPIRPQYLEQLSVAAGHPLDLRYIDPAAWVEASRRAHETEDAPMTEAIRVALNSQKLLVEQTLSNVSAFHRSGHLLRLTPEAVPLMTICDGPSQEGEEGMR